MPTDLVALLARKQKARALAQDDAKLMLVWFAATGLVIEILFAFHSFKDTMILLGAY
jgi:hypothetical protein